MAGAAPGDIAVMFPGKCYIATPSGLAARHYVGDGGLHFSKQAQYLAILQPHISKKVLLNYTSFPTATRCWVPISLPMPLRCESCGIRRRE